MSLAVRTPNEKVEQPLAEVGSTENGDTISLYEPAILRRHGSTDLVPPPSDDPENPYNWSWWRKNMLLAIVSFHAMQGPFGAAMVIPAFEDFARDFHITLHKAAYFVSVQILFLGVTPLIWTPLSKRIGRRPVYLASALLSSGCAFAGAFCHSYGTLMTTRVFQAIFICPPLSIGACTVSEMFFAHEKGRKMGIWVLLFILGPLSAPLVTGYLVQIKGWRSAFYLLAATHLGLFVAHFFFGPETLYLNRVPTSTDRLVREDSKVTASRGESKESKWYHAYGLRIYSRQPFHWMELWRPFTMAARPLVFLAAFGMTIPFGYGVLLMTIFVPEIFGPLFHLTPGQVGLQFISVVIGAVLGEQLAGLGSDLYVAARTRRASGVRKPEYRLALAYPGFLLSATGIIIWGIQLQNAVPGEWNVTPDIGSAIALFGIQLISSVCTTYAIESYQQDAADVSAFLTVVRQVFAFTVPFYMPIPVKAWGISRACGLFAGLVGVGMLMVMACHRWGPVWRNKCAT